MSIVLQDATILVSRTPTGGIIIRQGDDAPQMLLIDRDDVRALIEIIWRTANPDHGMNLASLTPSVTN